MTDFISQDGAQVQGENLSSMLISGQYTNVREEEKGRIFQAKNFAKDWDSVYVRPADLDLGVANRGMRKITVPTLIMSSHSPMIAFVLASEEEPVFVCSGLKMTHENGFILIFKLNPSILPDYCYYMSRYKSWVGISKGIDIEDKYDKIYGSDSMLGWKNVGDSFCDGIMEDVTTAENVFLNAVSRKTINIPSTYMQKQRIADAKSMERMLQEKMAEKERKFQQKEWLNEAHIRNSKHRLSNEIMPVRMAVERLQAFMQMHPDGIKLTDIIGELTKQPVNNLLEGLLSSIENMEREINNLTKSEQAGEPEQVLDVAKSVDDYINKVVSKYPRAFKIERIGFDAELKIKISPKDFVELLDNVVNNAVRHGFVKESREDYLLQFSIEATNNMCKIAIANNGEPMSERARSIYFEYGSFAGSTGHSGIGGNRIYEICDKAGGQAMPPYSKEGFPVVVCVELPLVY